MSKSKKPRGPIVELLLPYAVMLLIALVTSVIKALQGHPKLTSPNPPVPKMQADLDALQAAQTLARTRVPGAVQARDEKEATVRQNMEQFGAYLQNQCDALPIDEAIALIHSVMLHVRAKSSAVKQNLTAKQGGLLGTAKLRCRSQGDNTIYYWQFSLDGQNWSNAPETHRADTTISGLSAGHIYYFRFAWRRYGQQGDYSQSVSLLVK